MFRNLEFIGARAFQQSVTSTTSNIEIGALFLRRFEAWRQAVLLLLALTLRFIMQIQIELTEESWDLLMRHFKERPPLHEILECPV